MRKQQYGEQQLIELIQRTTRRRGSVLVGIGDDACVLPGGLVMTTDVYADDVHFSREYMSWQQIGERCTCAAISDVVAMGARPTILLVALTLPREAGRTHVRALYTGIERVCTAMGCEVAGGDIIVADRLALALTAVGRTRRPLLRSAAKPGETLYVTGSLGAAEAGRMLLLGGKPPYWAAPLIRRHLCPLPRLGVARALGGKLGAMIDTSDGLATDVRHLARLSRVRIDIDLAHLPIAPATRRFCQERQQDLTSFALAAGEDYELLFTSRHRLPAMVTGVEVTPIGKILRGRGVFVLSEEGVKPLVAHGYDHVSRSLTLG